MKLNASSPSDLPPVLASRARDLRRVRWIASLSAAVETAKLLPAIDIFVVAFEWAVLKTVVPGLLEVRDAWKEGARNPVSLSRAFVVGNWISLLHRAFGGAGGAAVLALDLVTDAETLLLPAPLDGFDIPAPLADAAIAAFAHRALQNLKRDAAELDILRSETSTRRNGDTIDVKADVFDKVA